MRNSDGSRLFHICAGVVFSTAYFASMALGAPAPSDACSNLKNTFSMPKTTITSAQTVPAGTFSPADPGPRATPVTGLPTFCRVIGKLTPTSDSEIGIEVWMPTTNWNGKFQSIGNHNLGGVIYYGDMGLQLIRNYAVASSDTGHIGNDAEWGAGHPEKVADFGWRAVHQLTLTAKAVIAAFYSANPRYSYFNGCSMGGKEALQEAQRFPDDYDGIISGSAMNNWTRSHMAHIWAAQVLLQDGVDGAHYIPPSKNELILNSVLGQCRVTGGQASTDGFLRNPSRCDWKPQTLVCKPGQDPNTCITAAQAESLEKLYSPIRNPRTKEEIYPATTITSALPNANGLTAGPAAKYLQWIVFNKPDWKYSNLNFDSDVVLADTSDAEGPQINAIDPNLSGFQKRHGKLVEYHGWVDSGFTPEFNIQYYERVIARMGKDDAAALKQTQDFYRLFVVPGMGHCSGGPGPNAFGGLAQPAVPIDPQHDILSALEQWVEHGVAPAQLIATKYNKDDPKQGIAMQRPVCPYPQEAEYKGRGSTADPSNFACVNELRNLKLSRADRIQPQPVPKR
jgi:tannase/feruloyl esterase